MAEKPGLMETLKMLERAQAGRTARMDDSLQRRRAAAGTLQRAQNAPVNRRLRNPGQSGLDVLGLGPEGRQNQTANQNRALLQMGLGMMGGRRGQKPGAQFSRGITQGLGLLDELRETDRERKVDTAKTAYEIADLEVDAAENATSGGLPGVGGLLTNRDLPSNVRSGIAAGLMSEEERSDFAFGNRAPTIRDAGGGASQRYNPATGQMELITRPGETVQDIRQDFSAAEAQAGRAQAYADAEGKGQAGIDVAFEEALGNEYLEMTDFLVATEELLAKVKSGVTDRTGLIEGRLAKYVDPDTAELNAASITAAVDILSQAKLQPVSDKEFQTILSSVANTLAEPAVNARLLERQVRLLRERMDIVRAKARHFRESGGTLRGFAAKEFEMRMDALNRGAAEAKDREEAPPDVESVGANPRRRGSTIQPGMIDVSDLPPLPEEAKP